MRWTDWVLTRVLRLPRPTTEYEVRRDVRVSMRDGVELLADHYAPTASRPAGTILVRGPYGRRGIGALVSARAYAARGYHVVMQSTRGTFGSGGEFAPIVHEVEDGADTVAWLRDQPWFTGRFATMGGSYLGYTQWAMLVDPPPEFATAVISVAPHDLSAAAWGTGAFALSDFLGWSDLVAHQEDGGLKPLVHGVTARWRIAPALDGLPLGDAGRTLLRDRAPWYQSWVSESDVSAAYWQPTRADAALDQVKVPVLLQTGWQDVFFDQTLHQFARLRARGVDAALTVGPWTHMEIGTRGAGEVARESLDWLAEHLAGLPVRRRSDPVRIFVTGGVGWRDLSDWPPATSEKILYLQPLLLLGDEQPSPAAAPSRFVYDPADPTPTIGGRMLSDSGYRDDTRLAERDDVLSFTSTALTENLEVVGSPAVELVHSTDIPHADVFVRLSEVDAMGTSRNVSDGYLRLSDDRPATLRIELDAIAHRFRAGHRIRMLIAGGSHPRFARNLGTAEPAITGHRLARCTHTVAHGSGGVSRVVLPVA